MKEVAAEKASLVVDQMREKAGLAAQLVQEKLPDPVREKTVQAAAQAWDTATRAGQYAVDKTPAPLWEKAGRAATAARAHRTPLLAACAVIVALSLVRRSRGRRR
ncbi:hypothetical protein ACIRP0_27975 [Streptomyces sp. NPDC101733]|uniref:hypothetical protein n=1 Tax=unclassified Streptomyces TaxID=2593676 RepID=UPI0038097883